MIVVTTPTGQVGSQLTRMLLDRGSEVRVIVRDASRLDDDIRDQVEVVEGSHADPAVLNTALAGADALFWLVPPDSTAPSAEELYVTFARAGAAAVARHNVGHVVSVSSAGHGWTAPAGVLSAAFAMDAELAKSNAAYRAVSPPGFMENFLGQLDAIRGQGAFYMTFAGDRPLPVIATRDIAATVAELLTDLSWTGQENVPVFGPDRLTPDGIADVIGEELGLPVAYRRITLEDLESILHARGASPQRVEDMTAMAVAQDSGIYDEDWATAMITETDFRSWCRKALQPAIAATLQRQ